MCVDAARLQVPPLKTGRAVLHCHRTLCPTVEQLMMAHKIKMKATSFGAMLFMPSARRATGRRYGVSLLCGSVRSTSYSSANGWGNSSSSELQSDWWSRGLWVRSYLPKSFRTVRGFGHKEPGREPPPLPQSPHPIIIDKPRTAQHLVNRPAPPQACDLREHRFTVSRTRLSSPAASGFDFCRPPPVGRSVGGLRIP